MVQTSNSPASNIWAMRLAIDSAASKRSLGLATSSMVSMMASPNSRRSWSRPLRPTQSSLTVLPSLRSAAMRRRTSRTMPELKPPQSPRSAVPTTNR